MIGYERVIDEMIRIGLVVEENKRKKIQSSFYEILVYE